MTQAVFIDDWIEPRHQSWASEVVSMSSTGNEAGSILCSPRIKSTPGICGGNPRIAGTRMPVWGLVAAQEDGCSDSQILENYPFLTQDDLDAAWLYRDMNLADIRQQIDENQDV